jgi:hypothetical protein
LIRTKEYITHNNIDLDIHVFIIKNNFEISLIFFEFQIKLNKLIEIEYYNNIFTIVILFNYNGY